MATNDSRWLDALPEVEDVRRLHLRPGDVLFFRVRIPITYEQAEALRRRIVSMIGEQVPILIISSEVDIGVVSRNVAMLLADESEWTYLWH